MEEIERRQALADFLRTRRARLSQAEVGLPARNRQRTPGLRREDVAELANIGVSWYTSLEQGKDVHPSKPVLESLAQALKLNHIEEKYLFLLAGHTLPMQAAPEEEEVSPELRRVVEVLNPHPAFVIGRRWDVLYRNRAADLVFCFDEPFPPYSLNIVWRYFQMQGRSLDADWEEQARNLVAQFRTDYARYPGDTAFEELLHDLQDTSPLFREWWEEHDIRGLPNGRQIKTHPALGSLEFDHVTVQTAFPNLRMKIYAASPASTLKLEQALSSVSF
jgi:transcriptional regulator with XRE-family HTH domain